MGANGIMPEFIAKLLGALGGLKGYLIVGLVSGIACASGGFYVAHKMGQMDVAAIKLREAAAKMKAINETAKEQQRVDRVGFDAALALAETTLNIEVGQVHLVTEIERHVTVHSIACVPYGLVRVLDAAVLGRGPEALLLPAGVSDDTCAPVDAVALARNISANYGQCRINAAQLDALTSALQRVAGEGSRSE